MTDLLAIVSKAVFEADSKSAKPGQVLPLDRYVSTNKALEPLRAGGRLFLVTVRPPDEQLWLVAVLDATKHDGKAWVAKPNRQPITDVSALRGKIRFTSDTGISMTKGALGMCSRRRASSPRPTSRCCSAARLRPPPPRRPRSRR